MENDASYNQMMTIRGRGLWDVLKQGWPAYTFLVGLALAVGIGCSVSATLPAAVRDAGMILELLGLATVAVGLSQTRRLFGRPSLTAGIVDWFRRLAGTFKTRRPMNLEASVGEYAIAGSGAGLEHSAGPDSSVDRRLSILEEDVKRLRTVLSTRVQELRQELATVQESVQRERHERREGDEKTARMLAELAVGGLHLETVGLLWLMLGVIGASIPDEVASWFCCLGLANGLIS